MPKRKTSSVEGEKILAKESKVDNNNEMNQITKQTLELVFEQLEEEEALVQCMQVSHLWNEVASQNNLWKTYFCDKIQHWKMNQYVHYDIEEEDDDDVCAEFARYTNDEIQDIEEKRAQRIAENAKKREEEGEKRREKNNLRLFGIEDEYNLNWHKEYSRWATYSKYIKHVFGPARRTMFPHRAATDKLTCVRCGLQIPENSLRVAVRSSKRDTFAHVACEAIYCGKLDITLDLEQQKLTTNEMDIIVDWFKKGKQRNLIPALLGVPIPDNLQLQSQEYDDN